MRNKGSPRGSTSYEVSLRRCASPSTRTKVAQNASRSAGMYRQMPTTRSLKKAQSTEGALKELPLRAILLLLLLDGGIAVSLEVFF